jgi:membrane-associated phospholipid phosphatase
LPWFLFSSLGTVYLAQHYFIDVLVAFPLALVSIWLAKGLVRIEEKYYQYGGLDNQEKKLKEQIKEDLAKILRLIKAAFRERPLV